MSTVSSQKSKDTREAVVAYDEFLRNMQANFDRMWGLAPLLVVDTEGLWDLFLGNIVMKHQAQYKCRACADFVRRWGGIVVVDEHGSIAASIWSLPESEVPAELRKAVRLLDRAVKGRPVVNACVVDEKFVGAEMAGGFQHMNLRMPLAAVYKGVDGAAHRKATLLEDNKNLCAALPSWTDKAYLAAEQILNHGKWDRAEKFGAHLKWLIQRRQELRLKPIPNRYNLLWKAVAVAPTGWCSPRSQVLGSLLDDVQAGISTNEVRRRYEEKMDPLKYQRPQAAPKAGTIDAAERLFESMDLGRSLERRPARLNDLRRYTWAPLRPVEKAAGGLFGDLRQDKPSVAPQKFDIGKVSWRTVMEEYISKGDIRQIMVLVPNYSASFVAFTTAVHEDAKPILKWDDALHRNPVAWYFYAGGASASRFNLRPTWTRCVGITDKPSWYGNNHGHSFENIPTLLLEGAQDLNANHAGLFPETLRAELHGVRSVIEAHSAKHPLRTTVVSDVPHAAGIDVPSNDKQTPLTIRLTTKDDAEITCVVDRLK